MLITEDVQMNLYNGLYVKFFCLCLFIEKRDLNMRDEITYVPSRFNAITHTDDNGVVLMNSYNGVADSGKSFNFNQVRAEIGPYTESSTVEQLTEGGLGLYLIETLMYEVRVMNHSGVTVFMMKYLNGERETYDTINPIGKTV